MYTIRDTKYIFYYTGISNFSKYIEWIKLTNMKHGNRERDMYYAINMYAVKVISTQAGNMKRELIFVPWQGN